MEPCISMPTSMHAAFCKELNHFFTIRLLTSPTQADSSVPDPLLEAISLKNLPPLQLPRLWSVLHGCLLYNDPAQASGGKVDNTDR